MDAKLKYPVITIGREYCAYGRSVAAKLEEQLGIKYYDKDFVNKIIIESGFPEETVEKENERMSGGAKFWEDLLSATATYSSSYDRIFEAQKQVVIDLAKEPCILVGRAAGNILREAGINSFNIYLYADIETRVKRCAELNPELKPSQMEKYVRKIDSDRQTYYKRYTGTDLDDPHNYNICLDVGTLGLDQTVETILALVR